MDYFIEYLMPYCLYNPTWTINPIQGEGSFNSDFFLFLISTMNRNRKKNTGHGTGTGTEKKSTGSATLVFI